MTAQKFIFKLCLGLLFCSLIGAKFYSLDIDFKVQEVASEEVERLKIHNRILGVSEFIDNRNTTGWTYYSVFTNGSQPDWLQTYTAGYLESYLAYELVWASYNNRIAGLSKRGFEGLPQNVSNFVKDQTEWAVQMVLQNRDDPYWNLVNATMAQVQGMWAGYQAAALFHRRIDIMLTFEEFYLITYIYDLGDVMAKFTTLDLHELSCSFLLKMTDEGLYASHTTWGGFMQLIRIYRILNLNLNNPIVNTKRMSLASQPGTLSSLDDYYVVDNNRVVTETTIGNANDQMYASIHFDSLPYWLRITVANLAFTDQRSWADVYYKYRSGTYNNQWLVIDFNNYNAFKNNMSQARDIIWMIEEFYNVTSAIDVTQELLVPQGYVASYNVAYNATIQALSQLSTNYTTDSRYHLFKKYAPGIKNFEDFKHVMRMNNFSDTGDYCDAIASRCDLAPDQDYPSGAFDCKVTSSNLALDHKSWIISGPTAENVPPFDWNNWPSLPMAEMPEVFNFDWVFIDPAHNFTLAETRFISFEKLTW